MKKACRPGRAAESLFQRDVDLNNHTQRIFFRPFSIPNLAVARCNSNTGTVLQYSKTPSLRVVSFEDDDSRPRRRLGEGGRTCTKRLVRAGRCVDAFQGLKPLAESCYPFGRGPQRLCTPKNPPILPSFLLRLTLPIEGESLSTRRELAQYWLF